MRQASPSEKGFTLVELLVVISIIAILISIGISVYSTAQKSARDSRRKQEISAIQKALEASKNSASGTYKYDVDTFNKDFPVANGQPSDIGYCIWAQEDSTTPPTVPDNNCPVNNSGVVECNNCSNGSNYEVNAHIKNGASYEAFTTAAFTNGLVKSWTLCANLEGETKPFCRVSMSN